MPVDEVERLAVGAIRASPAERRKIAKHSPNYRCEICQMSLGEIAKELMLEPTDELQQEQLKIGDNQEEAE